MNGQMLQSLHFFMPGCVLTGLLGAMGGTLALMTSSFMLGGRWRLYATKGGRGYSLRWGSVLVTTYGLDKYQLENYFVNFFSVCNVTIAADAVLTKSGYSYGELKSSPDLTGPIFCWFR